MFRTIAIVILKQKPKRLFSSNMNLSVNEKLLLKLSNEYTNVSAVKNFLNTEEFSSVEFPDWKARIDLLKSYGFAESECFEMIAKHPLLLKSEVLELKKSVQGWNSSGLGIENSHYVLVRQPQFVSVEAKEIKRRIFYLISTFNSKKAITEFLIANPTILFDDWNEILKKIDFITNTKGVNKIEILQSEALSHSLHLIKLRFEVLEKSGVYKKLITYPHKKNNYDKSKHKNPHLKNITDLNNKIFAYKTAKINLEEYIVCNNLFTTFGHTDVVEKEFLNVDDNKNITDDDDDDDED